MCRRKLIMLEIMFAISFFIESCMSVNVMNKCCLLKKIVYFKFKKTIILSTVLQSFNITFYQCETNHKCETNVFLKMVKIQNEADRSDQIRNYFIQGVHVDLLSVLNYCISSIFNLDHRYK